MFEIKLEKKWCTAIYERAAVRSFTGEPTDEQLKKLGDLCRKLSWQGVRLRLFRGPGMRSFIKGTSVYCAVAIKKNTAPELAGFYGEAVALEAVSMGLGTCWMGMFHKGIVNNAFTPEPEEKVMLLIAIGQCAKPTFAPKRKSLEVLTGMDTSAIAALDPWAKSALDAARVAPSAINLQPWRFGVEPRAISVNEGPAVIKTYVSFDRGIAMLHVSLGAFSAGREGRWQQTETGYIYKV